MLRTDLETMIVADVMNTWPATVPVFMRRRMACPGCVMAPFMTVAEAAREYDVEPEIFADELAAEIEKLRQTCLSETSRGRVPLSDLRESGQG